MRTTELAWFKSSYGGGGGGNCVEVACAPAPFLVRDSKDADSQALAGSPGAWSAFTALAADAHL
ncbi:DUF397 domain-containing protein [Streptomyces sp. NPDC017179]|uniref:DUF397 domain-containing protein n=1 Tax=Streptomyces sp. NPDC017179 TaxID=3364979 RepID=UPI00378B7A83